jgi:hypothetical protein
MESNKNKKHQTRDDSDDSQEDHSIHDDSVSSDEEQVESLQKIEPSLPKTYMDKANNPRLIVVLE